jgi:hypothetical protein
MNLLYSIIFDALSSNLKDLFWKMTQFALLLFYADFLSQQYPYLIIVFFLMLFEVMIIISIFFYLLIQEEFSLIEDPFQ